MLDFGNHSVIMAIQDLKTGRLVGQEAREKNPAWKGDTAKSRSIHSWVNDNFDAMDVCELCSRPNDGSMMFDWSNKDHKYSRERKDWQHVCRSCHNKYDYAHNSRGRKNGKR